MQCYTCQFSSICKVFQMANDFKIIADVYITNCKVFFGQVLPTGESVINTNPGQPNNNFSRTQRTPQQLNEISERIRKEHDKLKKKPKEKEEAKDISIQEKLTIVHLKNNCPTCGAEAGTLLKCAGCGKDICHGCAVESIEDGQPYCEECWDRL